MLEAIRLHMHVIGIDSMVRKFFTMKDCRGDTTEWNVQNVGAGPYKNIPKREISILIISEKGLYYMHVISRRCLVEFGTCHPNVKEELDTWFYMMEKNEYPSPISIKQVFGSADVIAGDRIIFNIKGNSYRIIVKVKYSTQTMFIRFIGTHAEYSKVHAETI